MIPKTFPKSERLNKKKLIKELFAKGSSFYLYPFKVLYIPSPDDTANQVLISVPKHLYKKAVDRNKIRRRTKEAYRLNKDRLEITRKLLITYIYTAKEIITFDVIEKKVAAAIKRLNETENTSKHA